jgi:hypothetical protein
MTTYTTALLVSCTKVDTNYIRVGTAVGPRLLLELRSISPGLVSAAQRDKEIKLLPRHCPLTCAESAGTERLATKP